MNQSQAPLVISRIFKAPRDLVFKAHTEVHHLEKWWMPTGFKSIYSSLDFKIGGCYHYANESPDGMQIWGKQVFQDFVLNERLTCVQFFSDKDGNVQRHPMSATWPLEMYATTLFEEFGEHQTKLTLSWQPINSDDSGYATFEAAKSGVEQAIGATFDKLENHLYSITN